jgi:hypothetical protein
MLDAGVELEVPELKVVDHCEPLFLLGTDVLADGEKEWRFCYVGLHPTKRTGYLLVVNSASETREIPLISWPMNGVAVKQ